MTEERAQQINASVLLVRGDVSMLSGKLDGHITKAMEFMTATERRFSAVRSISEDEHVFIRAMLVREQRKSERWNKVKTQTVGWAVIAALGWCAHQAYIHIARPLASRVGIQI